MGATIHSFDRRRAVAEGNRLTVDPGIGWQADATLAAVRPREEAWRQRLIDVRFPDGATGCLTCDPHRFSADPTGQLAIVEVSTFEVAFRETYRDEIVAAATCRSPAEMSARALGSARHVMASGFLALGLSALVTSELALYLLLTLIVLVAGATTLTRLLALLARQPAEHDELHHISREDLPAIDLLIPLYREAGVLPRLLAGLERLDYPRDRLSVRLLLEEDDAETAAALGRMTLPEWVRPLTVPDGQPRTKPRAMNVALDFCEGDLVGILDAEDRPDPGQLLRVAAQFARSAPELAAVQCQLAYFNARENWITRCFQIEYSIWFDVLLRGWQRLGLPLPLGGTSVYFRRAALEALGGWDAHNVTEDADLGMRIARAGLRTDVVLSTTDEEANCRVRPWIRQRSRWLKGYMMTWLSHMRRPARLWRDLGPVGFAGFQILFLGGVLSYLAIPLFWAALALSIFLGRSIYGDAVPAEAAWLMIAVFATGQAVMLTAAAVALVRRRSPGLIMWVPLMPVYWSMGAIAAWKAIAELAVAPYFWDKTDHGLTRLAPVGDSEAADHGRAL